MACINNTWWFTFGNSLYHSSGNWLFGSSIQRIGCLETRDWLRWKAIANGWVHGAQRARMEAHSCLCSWKIPAWCWGDSKQNCCPGSKEACLGVQCLGGAAEVQEQCYRDLTQLQWRRWSAIRFLCRPTQKVQRKSSQAPSHQEYLLSDQMFISTCISEHGTIPAPVCKHITYLYTFMANIPRIGIQKSH